MAKQFFKAATFKPDQLELIERSNRIIATYQAAGYVMTARQLYYQHVAHDWIENTEQSYKRLTDIISRARLAGLVDWDAIEDRGRVPEIPTEFSSPEAALKWLAAIYRERRWIDQPRYVELWVEKQALAGVLRPLADRYHVPLMVNKGYSSQSAMYESAQRIMKLGGDLSESVVLYLGDFDPSGNDMVRDIRERLEMFGVRNLRVDKLGLTWAQIQTYKPPPNPAKITDPRARGYIEEFGDESWEVDSLGPDVTGEIIRDALKKLIDHKRMRAALKRERANKKLIFTGGKS